MRLLQARTRRFYRIRELHDLRCEAFGRHLACLASYTEDGHDIQLVDGYVSTADLPDFAEQLREFLGTLPPDRRVVVDVEAWRAGDWMDADLMAAELAGLLSQTDFGRALDRFDIALTYESGPDGPGEDEEHLRTQHFTFRPGEPGSPRTALPQHAPDDRRAARPVAAVELPSRAAAVGRGCLPVPGGGPG